MGTSECWINMYIGITWRPIVGEPFSPYANNKNMGQAAQMRSLANVFVIGLYCIYRTL